MTMTQMLQTEGQDCFTRACCNSWHDSTPVLSNLFPGSAADGQDNVTCQELLVQTLQTDAFS